MMKTCFLCQSSDLLVKSIHDNICKYTVCLFIARDWIWDKLSFIFHFFFMKDDDAGETEQGAASSDADATNESGPESEKKKRIFSKECKWVWQFESCGRCVERNVWIIHGPDSFPCKNNLFLSFWPNSSFPRASWKFIQDKYLSLMHQRKNDDEGYSYYDQTSVGPLTHCLHLPSTQACGSTT